MAIAYLCILIAAIMPLVFAAYAKFSSKGYDNSRPRDFLAKLEGKSQRANYAQLNSFEAFPAFAASVIVARLAGVDTAFINALSVAFVCFRVVYGICYVMDKPRLRSTFWFFAFACVVSLFVKLSCVHDIKSAFPTWQKPQGCAIL